MTKAEYKRRYDDYNSQIINLQKKISDLGKEYVKHAPFKIGDKVLVKSGTKQCICFISRIGVDWHNEYEYKFVKPKKDGTMSWQSAGIYYVDEMKLYEPS